MRAPVEALSLHGRHAVVVGADGGFGTAITAALEAAGASVVGMDLRGEGEHTIAVDVSDADSVRAAFDELAGRVPKLDILVNTAGIREIEPLATLAPETWQRVLAVNLTGPFLCIQAALPLLRAAQGAAVVNIASIAGLTGMANRPAYTASKHGLVGLTRNLAHDLGPDKIRVNAVAPGTIRTPMTEGYYADQTFLRQAEAMVPLGFDGSAVDVADAVLYLAGPLARHVTGVVLPVDGGFTAQMNYAPLGAGPAYEGDQDSTS